MIDVSDLRERLGEDDEMLAELLESFLGDAERLVGEIRAAAGRADREALVRSAHALKGAAANLSVRALAREAAEAEQLAFGAEGADLADRAERLFSLLARVRQAVRTGAWRKQEGGP